MTKNKVQKSIIKNKLLGNNELVIVALSGGYDSLCLVHIMKELGYSVRAAHLNHELRVEAEEDCRYIHSLCNEWNIPVDIERADVKTYSEKNKMSVETAGRELRYNFFARQAEQYGGVIATAHNLNDHAESVIMHLLRGSGMTGLIGIRAAVTMNGVRIIRPLLTVSRAEIEKYLQQNNIMPLNDATNDSNDYWRNEIRHMVMPPIIQRGGLDSIARATEILSAEDDFLEEYTCSLTAENAIISENKVTIDNKWFCSLHKALQRRVLRSLIAQNWRKPVSLLHINSVIAACEKNYGGKVIQLPDMLEARIKAGKLTIERGGNMHDEIGHILIDRNKLDNRVGELAKIINHDYKGKQLVMIGVLKGCVPFMADLLRRLTISVEIDFMAVSSYGTSAESSGVVKILKEPDIDLLGKNVLIVEDIIDSGRTLSYLKGFLNKRNPADIKICTILNKPGRREVDVQVDYIGFDIPDEFVVGYGLDYAEKYRNLPYVGVLKRETYSQKG